MGQIANDCPPLIDTIQSPQALREQPLSLLPVISAELREELIQSVSNSGGHLAAGLGVVELTIALHYVLDTPRDRLIWDVGHQAYPHKMLTERKVDMPGIRQLGGISGFPCRGESHYDCFGVAHAGTSISAALGMAAGAALSEDPRKVVAVIGDGAITAGMAYEALNQLGQLQSDVLIVLNDNGMSISPNVGALGNGHEHDILNEARVAGFFESFGIEYSGPIDGHNVIAVAGTLKAMLPRTGPRVLHVITQKGKGYTPAEQDPVKYHGVGSFDPQVGIKPAVKDTKSPVAKLSDKQTYTQVFSDWVCDMAEQDPGLVAITPAMREGSGLVDFAKRYSERYYDAGIAEQHAVTLGAGFACENFHPVVAIYSSFLQRAYDQLIHDVALQNLPVLFAIDRGGLAGADGATHHGSFDLSYLRCVPNMVIMAPADENECRQMLTTGYHYQGPAAVRYPRGGGIGTPVEPNLESIPIGTANWVREGKSIAILNFGSLLGTSYTVAEQIDASLINMRFIKPLDTTTLAAVAESHDILVTVEDNAIAGGAGSAVNEWLMQQGILKRIINLGLPDSFVEHGTREEILAVCGLDEDSILERIQNTAAELQQQP